MGLATPTELVGVWWWIDLYCSDLLLKMEVRMVANARSFLLCSSLLQMLRAVSDMLFFFFVTNMALIMLCYYAIFLLVFCKSALFLTNRMTKTSKTVGNPDRFVVGWEALITPNLMKDKAK